MPMQPPKPHPSLAFLAILTGLFFLALTAGFFLQLPWATSLWPWPDGRLSYIFVSSITAAIAVPVLWIGIQGEWGASAGGAFNLCLAFGGMGVHLARLYAREGGDGLLWYAVLFPTFSLFYLGYGLWSASVPVRDPRPMPRPVRVSMGVFSAVLILTGLALVLKYPRVFPWPLKPDSSVMFGWIFLGAAVYFAYGCTRSRWHDAKSQLLGFLAYDLILLPPYLKLFPQVKPGHLTSLAVYTSVLLYSAALAVYYLFLSPRTRSWKIRTGD